MCLKLVLIQRAFSMQSHTGLVCTNKEAACAQGALVRHQGKEMHKVMLLIVIPMSRQSTGVFWHQALEPNAGGVQCIVGSASIHVFINPCCLPIHHSYSAVSIVPPHSANTEGFSGWFLSSLLFLPRFLRHYIRFWHRANSVSSILFCVYVLSGKNSFSQV